MLCVTVWCHVVFTFNHGSSREFWHFNLPLICQTRTYLKPTCYFSSVFSFLTNFDYFYFYTVWCQRTCVDFATILLSNIVICMCSCSILLEFNCWILVQVSLTFLFSFDWVIDRLLLSTGFNLDLIYFTFTLFVCLLVVSVLKQ